MSESTRRFFGNSDLLVGAVGHWPSFHDARITQGFRRGDACVVSIQVFETTTQVGPNGTYVQTKQNLVTLTMSAITECTLPDSYGGDVLFDLTAERRGELIRVSFDSATDPSRSWWVVCGAAEISAVVPCGSHRENAI